MLDEWKTYKLDEFCEPIRKGYTPKSSEDLAYIGLEHIEQQTLRLLSVGQSSDVTSNKLKFESGDVLFGKLRPYFRKVYRPKFSGICSTDISVFRAKKNFDTGYLFYLLATKDFIDYSNAVSSGTRMPRADWNLLKNSEWAVPNLKTQQRIASILSSLDDAIELNQQINKTLEEMAKAIFKEWFVDFNFPNATGKFQETEIGKIPVGWKEGKLGDIVDTKGGTTPSTTKKEYWDGEYYWTSPRDLSNLQTNVLLDTSKKITALGLKQISSGILPKGTLLLSSRAPIGYLAISEVPISINQGFIAINGTKVSNLFMLYWLKENMQTIINNANGSTFLEISKTVFRNIPIAIPSSEVLEKFEEIISSIYNQILNNEKENQSLSKLRDTLLPKLMKGEININL